MSPYLIVQFEAGTLVIRYDDQILQPSGDFQSDITDDEDSDGLLGWHIAIIVVGIVAVLVVIAIIVIAVGVNKRIQVSSS